MLIGGYVMSWEGFKDLSNNIFVGVAIGVYALFLTGVVCISIYFILNFLLGAV